MRLRFGYGNTFAVIEIETFRAVVYPEFTILHTINGKSKASYPMPFGYYMELVSDDTPLQDFGSPNGQPPEPVESRPQRTPIKPRHFKRRDI